MNLIEKVQITIEECLPDGTFFRDAIYIPVEERETLTTEEIEVMAQARVDAFIEAVSNLEPDPVEEITDEENGG